MSRTGRMIVTGAPAIGEAADMVDPCDIVPSVAVLLDDDLVEGVGAAPCQQAYRFCNALSPARCDRWRGCVGHCRDSRAKRLGCACARVEHQQNQDRYSE